MQSIRPAAALAKTQRLGSLACYGFLVPVAPSPTLPNPEQLPSIQEWGCRHPHQGDAPCHCPTHSHVCTAGGLYHRTCTGANCMLNARNARALVEGMWALCLPHATAQHVPCASCPCGLHMHTHSRGLYAAIAHLPRPKLCSFPPPSLPGH